MDNFLEVYCHVRKTNVFIEISHIIALEEFALIPGKNKGCWICVNTNRSEEGAYQVHEEPKAIIKKIEIIREG